MDNDTKSAITIVSLAILAIIAGLLFGGTPDIADALRDWISRQ